MLNGNLPAHKLIEMVTGVPVDLEAELWVARYAVVIIHSSSSRGRFIHGSYFLINDARFASGERTFCLRELRERRKGSGKRWWGCG